MSGPCGGGWAAKADSRHVSGKRSGMDSSQTPAATPAGRPEWPPTLYSPAPISAATGLVIAILALLGPPLISSVTWPHGAGGVGAQ